MTVPGRNVYVESVCRTTGATLSRLPVFVPASGPPDYAEHLCRRMSDIGGSLWRVCDPQPEMKESA